MKKLVYTLTIILMIVFVANTVTAGIIVGKVTSKSKKLTGADVLIFIEKVGDNKFAPPKEHAKIDQIKFVFTPHILPIVVGTTVDFHNSDDVLHNVFTPSKVSDEGGFNLGTWPKDFVKPYTFEKIAIATILCNVHPEMEAYVAVLPNPYFAVTDKEGNFQIPTKNKEGKITIPELPAGTYKVHLWHEKSEHQFQEITVPKDGTITVDFSLVRGKPIKISSLYKKE